MRTIPTLACATTLIALAGCGSTSTGTGDSRKSGAAILSCLEGRYPAAVSDKDDDLDYIAQAAGDKGIHVGFERNDLNIAVERSESDAKQTLKSYALFLPNAGSEQLSRVGTAVVAYDKTPLTSERDPVKACLGG